MLAVTCRLSSLVFYMGPSCRKAYTLYTNSIIPCFSPSPGWPPARLYAPCKATVNGTATSSCDGTGKFRSGSTLQPWQAGPHSCKPCPSLTVQFSFLPSLPPSLPRSLAPSSWGSPHHRTGLCRTGPISSHDARQEGLVGRGVGWRHDHLVECLDFLVDSPRPCPHNTALDLLVHHML